MRSLIPAVVCCALLASACSGDASATSSSTTIADTSTSSTTTIPATTTMPASTTTTCPQSSTTLPRPMELPIATDDAPPLEVLFSLAVDGTEITYEGDPTLTDAPLTGPQAVTVDHEGKIWIADTEALRIVRFTQEGEVLLDIDTDADGVGPIIDLAHYGEGVVALEVVVAIGRYRLVWYSFDGELLMTAEIPRGYHLEDGLTGIATGPCGQIWIELGGEGTVHEVMSLETPLSPEAVPGYENASIDLVPLETADGAARFAIGESVVEIPVRDFGSLLYEGAVPGAIALLHSDVVLDDVLLVDDTIVYVDLMGVVLAEADYPLDDVAYVAQERTAVGPGGDLFALLPRLDRLDVVSLTLYPPGHFGLEG